MVEELAPFIMVTALGVLIAVIIIAFLNFMLRWKILASGHVDEKLLELLKRSDDKQTMLKWGLVLLFGGIGLIVLQFLPFYAEQSPLPWGIEIIFIAVGFLAYYLIVRKGKR
ncbi:MAG TPA: DUF6249 domain-containing protein [Pedobacter sp.]|jgi:hypothetical protein